MYLGVHAFGQFETKNRYNVRLAYGRAAVVSVFTCLYCVGENPALKSVPEVVLSWVFHGTPSIDKAFLLFCLILRQSEKPHNLYASGTLLFFIIFVGGFYFPR